LPAIGSGKWAVVAKPHAITQPGLQDALNRLIEQRLADRRRTVALDDQELHIGLAKAFAETGIRGECDFPVRRMLVAMKYSLPGQSQDARRRSASGIGTVSFATSRSE